MYWVVLACALLVESWTEWILVWCVTPCSLGAFGWSLADNRDYRIPFYAYIRLLFLLYLVLPQTQGARIIYQDHIHPWLEENETQIDEFIASAHDRLKTAGIAYLKRAIELLKTNILGLPAEEPTPVAPEAVGQTYTQSLLARFSLPAARWTGTGNTGADFYSLLASAVSAATAAAAGTGTADMTASGTLIPPTLRGADEKRSFIAAQREKLNIVLGALDREAKELDRTEALRARSQNQARAASMTFDGLSDDAERPASGLSGFSALSALSKSRSEADFEKIDAESGAEDDVTARRRTNAATGQSWLPWGWGAAATPSEDEGQSSSFEKPQ